MHEKMSKRSYRKKRFGTRLEAKGGASVWEYGICRGGEGRKGGGVRV